MHTHKVMLRVYDHAGLLFKESFSKVATHPCLPYEPLTKGTYKCLQGIYALETSRDMHREPNQTRYQTVIKLSLLKSNLITMYKPLEVSFLEEVSPEFRYSNKHQWTATLFNQTSLNILSKNSNQKRTEYKHIWIMSSNLMTAENVLIGSHICT